MVVGTVGIGISRQQSTVVTNKIGPIARRHQQNAVATKLDNLTDTWLYVFRELIVYKTAQCFVVAVETSVGANPKTSLTVTKHADHHIVTDGRGIIVAMQKHFEAVAVKAVQTIIGGYPDAAIAVLAEAGNQST